MDLSMNSYEELYQTIMNNLRNNILNSYGVNDNSGQNALFGENALFGQNALGENALGQNALGQNIQLNQGSFQNILQSSLNQKNKYIKVLSENGKNSIKYVDFNKNKHNETFCPICQDDFEESQTVAVLPCGHIFEKNSIIQWLTDESNKCPVCRYEMDYIEKVDESVAISTVEDMSNNVYRSNVLSFLDVINERREERYIQRAIEESLKSMVEREDFEEDFEDDDSVNSYDSIDY